MQTKTEDLLYYGTEEGVICFCRMNQLFNGPTRHLCDIIDVVY